MAYIEKGEPQALIELDFSIDDQECRSVIRVSLGKEDSRTYSWDILCRSDRRGKSVIVLRGILTRGTEQLRQILLPEGTLPHSGTATDLRVIDVQSQILLIGDGVRWPQNRRRLAVVAQIWIPDHRSQIANHMFAISHARYLRGSISKQRDCARYRPGSRYRDEMIRLVDT